MAETVEVLVGVIGRAHGIRGDVAVVPRTDEPERRFTVGARLRTDAGRVLTVASSKWHSGRLILSFAELADRTAVEAARGWELLCDVAVDEVPEDESEYYDRQLIGLTVLGHDGVRVGSITDVLHLPAQDVLEIQTPDGVRLVPFVTELVPGVDLPAGHVTLADVEGLLDE